MNMISDSAPIWLTEADIRAQVSLNDTINALEQGLRLEAKGEATNVDKALGTWPDRNSMHALGSMMPQRGYVGFKTWVSTPNGAAAVFSLFDSTNGRLLAMMEAAGLGQMRTSGISGVATRAMAAPDADDMALVGTGAQAPMQVAAIAVTRKLRRLRVFSPSPDKRAAFVAKLRGMFDFEIVECDDIESTVDQAPIITLITRASAPFLTSSMVSKGAHINAAGAILPGNSEFTQDIFDRASLVFVDSINNARKASQEMIDWLGKEPNGWENIRTLGEILLEGKGRPVGADITLFKPMGMGLSDLCVAIAAYEGSRSTGCGSPLPEGQRAAPRWIAAA